MRRPLTLLLCLFLTWALAPGTAWADTTPAARRVVVVGVPGLLWSDVDSHATPQLWSLAGDSAIGALSVRSARSRTCELDGWASLGAGNRAAWPVDPAAPSEPAGSTPGTDPTTTEVAPLTACGTQEQVVADGLGDPVAALDRIADDPATARFGARPGALGEAVGCASVIGGPAGLAVAAPGVTLTSSPQLPADPAQTAALLSGCALGVVGLDQLAGVQTGELAQPDTDPATGDPAGDAAARAAALAAVDAGIGVLRAAVAQLPGDTLLIVAGVSEVDGGQAQLHVAMVSGPGATGGWLTSASTGREPFVQLIDLAPTALSALGLAQPDSMNGQPVQATGERPELAQAVSRLDRANTRAVVHHNSVGDFFWTLVAVNAALVAAGIGVLGARRRVSHPRGRAVLRPLALAVAALPVSTYLVGVLPWELAGSPHLVLAAAVGLVDVAVTLLAACGPWRRARLGPPLVVLGVTLGTLVADVVTGSHLELDGLLGYDAIVAGRFVGYGNLTFGLFSVSALLLTTAVATAGSRRVPEPDRPRRALVLVLVAAVPGVALIGAPFWGRDFGGVLAGLPGFLLLAMLLGRIRVTVTRLALVIGAGVLAVGAVAVLDWLRPADQRTHLGRFVAQVLDGQAWTVISRKGQANLDILLGSALAWVLPVMAVAAVWLLYRDGRLRGAPGRPVAGLPAPDLAALRAGLTAIAASLTLGALVNDSGVAVPATAATLLVPLLVWLVAVPDVAADVSEVATGAPEQDPAGAADRVSVTSRGSTGATS